MPSASNKLEKQSSIGSVGNAGGGGGIGPSNQSVQSSSSAGPKASISSESNSTSAVAATASAINNISISSTECSNTANNSSSASINAKGTANISGGGLIGSAADANNPMKQSLITIDHKIRNLEKRKTKLESYSAIQASGKELSADQKAAVAKYEAVIATLDFARDLSKQMMQLSKDAEKEQKKQARKDLIARAHAETAKMREMLIIQNILTCFLDESVRADFSKGDNGAMKMDAGDLAAIEKFCLDIQIRRPETADDVAFIASAQKAAEYLSMTIDGRPKQYAETTFENLRRVFNQIQECGYLDKIFMITTDVSGGEKEVEEFIETPSVVPGEDFEETITAEEGFLEEGMESLTMGDGVMIVDAVAPGQMLMAGGDGNGNVMSQAKQLQQQPMELQQQQQVKEQIEIQQQQINASIQAQQQHQQIQQQQQQGMQGAPPSVVPQNFQQAPPQQQQASGTTTPVHHVAMFPTQQQQQMQPPQSQHLQQLAQPPPGSIISVPPPQMVVPQQQQQVPPPQQQQRQLMASPGSAGGPPGPGQLPPQGGATMPLHGAPPGHFPPTTVRAVEQSFFKHQQYIQQMRPLNEVIAGGSFYFLQESELDSPELANVIGVAGNAAVPVVGGVIFEQQQTVPPQINVMGHVEMANVAAEMHKTQQQPIPTQTFTNQSFPPIPQQQQQQQIQTTPPTAGNSGNASTLTSQTPSPMFQQKHQQLFSPVATPVGGLQPQQQQQQQDIVANAGNVQQQQQQQQQIILNEQQQQQQQPMMIMARLATAAAPQPRLQPPQQTSPQQQQPPPPLGAMQPSDFSFENSVVTSLTYEQMQQQLAAAAIAASSSLKSSTEDKKSISDDSHINYNPEPVVTVNEWEATLKSHAVVATRAAQSNNAALTSALKQPSANSGVGLESSNNWSTEMNAISTPTTPNNNSNATVAQQARKNDWATGSSTSVGGTGGRGGDGNGGSGYGDAAAQPQTHETNHWNSNQQQDVHFSNNARYNNTRRRGRNNNYGSSSSQQQNGGGGGGRGGNGGGIYFRNNDNSSSGGGSSYYQNGGSGGGGSVYSSGKDNGSRYDSGNYRGPRGGNGGGGNGNNVRGNGPPTRSLGSRNGSDRGGPMNSSSSSYLNTRQSSNRMSMGMENKN